MSSLESDDASTPTEGDSRRQFIKKASLGGLSLGAMSFGSPEEEVEYATQNVSRHSSPSDLEITDLRYVQVGNTPIIRIDTNQDVHGLGDVRDGADPRYALMLKSRIQGRNPTNVEEIFKRIRQFGGHGRQGGGVSGVEMALWDLAGKAYEVPVYQLLGGKHRDRVQIYDGEINVSDREEMMEMARQRVEEHGLKWIKLDVGLGEIDHIPGTMVNADVWRDEDGGLGGWNMEPGSYGATEHPFTRVQITEKGIEEMAKFLESARETLGWELPIGIDHLGHFGYNEAIKIANRLEEYSPAWIEDLIPWFYVDQWKRITESTTIPTITGEDIYLLEGFKELIDKKAVDMIHPDPVTAGGLLPTKKIGDYAEKHGIPMALHHASSPVSHLASVHMAAATENFVSLEHHSLDNPWWDDLVTGVEKPIVQDGFVPVPEGPGIGIELNEEVVREHMDEDVGYFEPTPDWDEANSWDRQWS